MTSKDSDAGYELPQGFCKQSVYRIFGYTATEELEQFLQKCPRHYLRVQPCIIQGLLLTLCNADLEL